MFRSRPLQVLLLLTLGVTAVNAKEPNVAFGTGSAVTCKAYVAMVKDPNSRRLTDMVISWVQGYFSALNLVGQPDKLLTVGSTISSDTLQAMLADQCREEHPQVFDEVMFAAQKLYDKLKAKGL